MATYLENVTDIFPGSSDFDPDFTRIERMMRLRDNMYEQGARYIKNLYNSIFNSPMLRDENIKNRDAYLKTISESLNRVSGTDLSQIQNQQMAANLFTPILTDRNIAKDIAYTKSAQEQLKKVEALKNSTNADTHKQYWATGVKALNYQIDEFKNATAEKAMEMSTPTYTPNVPVLELAEKLYKDAGISVKEDNISGGYIWTKKNGDAVYPITKSFVEAMFNENPAIAEKIKTEAYVKRKDFIKQHATEFGGEDQAEAKYIQTVAATQLGLAQADVKNDETEVKKLQDKVDSWNKVIKSKGIVPGTQQAIDYAEDVNTLQAAEKALKFKKDRLSTFQMPVDFTPENMPRLRNQADILTENIMYEALSSQIARTLAFKDASLTAKVDQFSLARLRSELSHSVQSAIANQKHINSMILEGKKQANRERTLDIKQGYDLEKIKAREEAKKKNKLLTKKDKKNILNTLFGGLLGSENPEDSSVNQIQDQNIQNNNQDNKQNKEEEEVPLMPE